MVFVDTHVHFSENSFDIDREEVLERAKAVGVHYMIDIGTDIKSSRLAVENSELSENVFASVGIHPHDASRATYEDFLEIEKLLNHPRVKALGEIGLDYHYHFSSIDTQKKTFSRQLSIARERDIPVVVHVREAINEALQILDGSGKPPWRGVFHCFGGTSNEISGVLERGFYISFTGVVTFHNFKNTAAVKCVPMDRILLETDSPYMAPVPYRGKRNEPAFIVFTAKKIAEMYGITLDQLARMTTDNARMLFGLRV